MACDFSLSVMLCTVRLSKQESSVSLQSFIAEDALKSLSDLQFKDLATFVLFYLYFLCELPLLLLFFFFN